MAKISDNKKLTYERLIEVLDYNPLTGHLTWKAHKWDRKIGTKAGGLHNGYLRTHIDCEEHLCHRLAWWHFYGEQCPDIIDHINRDRTDNRIVNLRSGGESVNQRNVTMNSSNTSGITGVTWNEKSMKWRAYIHRGDGVEVHLGLYYSIYAAWEVRLKAEREYGYTDIKDAK